ncbi:MAG: Crp/Fnr family transcriptional regulator [Coprobacter sp.]|jgi:FNR family transcriptional regulator protein|uniref:Crp/Fnr family transcriptional regulator n=1 Tax=Barnesiella propionica TaxID=2981781 RepID=UPI000D7B6F43|nr:Crp/Fnr family transcriptional regulator [Barnesiella propionica]MBO1735923.1 Crp/Fnr family transcriptional regulator [Barnesiella sp. GGCC_0306]MBS7040326.1 Crp/Fnr family transcriptional regulator [Bacteroidales bacterium]MCU6767940.1 Crp/Fnr family transcriptional regulator [Barnesiella propionica]PWM88494.1 MAG: Crp/Fnr family transcriptional regulator [Coprobacter sp.]
MVKKSTLESILKEEMSEMWSVLTNEDKRIITDNFRIHTFKKNEVIYSEGEEPKLLMCLLKGKVKIYKDGVGGRSQIIRLIRPVQYFGYRAHFANENYVTAASAFETSTIGTLPMSIVEEQLKRNNQFALFFIKELATNLGISDARTVNLTQKHIRGRLAESLIFLKENYGLEQDGSTLNIYMAREDLANLSNMTTSNAIRTLSCFVNEKIIIVDGRKIKILDEEKLKKISKFG